MENRKISRGDIFFADLSPCVGSEQGGIRPVLVIQNDFGNKYSPTTIICCITSQCETKKSIPTHLVLEPNEENGLCSSSLALCEQIRTIDKQRLRQRLGKLSEFEMAKIDKAIKVSFQL